MKIVGKLHDYYDGLLAFGQDESLIFNRVTTSFEKKGDPIRKEVDDMLIDANVFGYGFYNHTYIPNKELTTKKCTVHMFSPLIVGFCGKAYFGLHVKSMYSAQGEVMVDRVIFNIEEAQKLIDTYQYKSNRHDFLEDGNNQYPVKALEKYGEVLSKVDFTDFSIKHRVPYFVINTQRGEVASVVFIPELKKYGFQKVKDPYTAYQEISMFVGGVIPRQMPELSEVSEADRIAQHGFNKLSFRNPIKFKDLK